MPLFKINRKVSFFDNHKSYNVIAFGAIFLVFAFGATLLVLSVLVLMVTGEVQNECVALREYLTLSNCVRWWWHDSYQLKCEHCATLLSLPHHFILLFGWLGVVCSCLGMLMVINADKGNHFPVFVFPVICLLDKFLHSVIYLLKEMTFCSFSKKRKTACKFYFVPSFKGCQ